MERTKVVIKPLVTKEIEKIPMEVSVAATIRPMLRYKVKGGSIKMGGKTYTSKDVFLAYPEQIPVAFRRDVVCLSSAEEQKIGVEVVKEFTEKESLYTVEKARAQGWYNVVNSSTKKAINEKTLRKDSAELLCASLNA